MIEFEVTFFEVQITDCNFKLTWLTYILNNDVSFNMLRLAYLHTAGKAGYIDQHIGNYTNKKKNQSGRNYKQA